MINGPDGKCLLTPVVPQEDDNLEALMHLGALYVSLGILIVTFGVSTLCWLGFKLPTHY